MERPKLSEHLPPSYLAIFQMMEIEGTLSVTRRQFFEDVRLKNFWQKVDKYTNSVSNQFGSEHVASNFTGAFFIDIDFFGQTGTSDNPSPSGMVVKNQKEVYKLLLDALKCTNNLMDIFDKVLYKSPYYPEEIESIYVDSCKVSTNDFLLKLNHALAEYPIYKILFEDQLGLIGSQSDSYMDWFHAVNDNLIRLQRMYNAKIKLTLDDYANLYCVFFEPSLDIQSAKDRIKKSIVSLKKYTTN